MIDNCLILDIECFMWEGNLRGRVIITMHGFRPVSLPNAGTKGRCMTTGPAIAVTVLCGLIITAAVAPSPLFADDGPPSFLRKKQGLNTAEDGSIPYQKWRIADWHEDKRYVWVAGHHDFANATGIDLILYFHGMHAKDYYGDFRRKLEKLAEKRSRHPFLFVGFVDTPHKKGRDRGKYRWKAMVPERGDRPDKLLRCVNRIFRALRNSFPNIRAGRTHIVMAGFSGGGRVLDSVGEWLATANRDDRYAAVFRSKLRKIVYFDCWFDPEVVDVVPALLARNPAMKIVGTVHMKKPKKHAKMLAGKLKLKKLKKRGEMVGVGGRLLILRGSSHWDAMICRLNRALGG
jgi:hypothetical protein